MALTKGQMKGLMMMRLLNKRVRLYLKFCETHEQR